MFSFISACKNSWNSVPILNDCPTKVNLDQNYFRTSISALQRGSWSCGGNIVRTGRQTTTERPDFTYMLLLDKQMRSTTRDGARKSFWQRLTFVGSGSKSGCRLICICHVLIRHIFPIRHQSCAFPFTTTHLTTRSNEMHLRGNNGELGRDKIMEQCPKLE